ncbi:putative cytochrome D ubiquinol oxydase CydB [Planomonospora parontospora subsp. parontospora]|uniref:Cytochrome D ubiquinol oxydase CydB n=2 Tax=Planomonospora parontospora TaxID=58119 RepID=A0AA37F6H4_9ACTN|nr:cytochrome d ubiquinol oxidase subunit II [Planomonospora parontospora]GGK84966.1 putative cytochrome D ubiquinol oxydase CydB [Planomonospora parontospora]GII10645.1 putative cytochrome D ubiquinol oxydase CydB [Planomonospora parontospora subsp. parontospora]
MELTTLWFAVIAFLWTGFFVLEGFDFGVGMLAPLVSRGEDERKQALATIGPVWDGNEVWLISAVGAMFAAFPAWYAGLLSAFYLPIVLVLAGLIVRGVGLEWRGKVAHSSDRTWCDLGIGIGSALPAFLWGAVFAALLHDGALAALAGGVFSLSLCLLHGAVFLTLKTSGPVRARARRAALAASAVVLPAGIAALSGIPSTTAAEWSADPGPWVCALAAMAALAAGTALTWRGREGWAFTATASSIALTGAALFTALWPSPLPGLTVAEAASGPYTLGVLTWIGLIALPFVLGYQGWTYWVFRRRLTAEAS